MNIIRGKWWWMIEMGHITYMIDYHPKLYYCSPVTLVFNSVVLSESFFLIDISHIVGWGENRCGVVANVLDCDIVVSEFELWEKYQLTNPHLQLWVKKYNYCSSIRIALTLTHEGWQAVKETKPNDMFLSYLEEPIQTNYYWNLSISFP